MTTFKKLLIAGLLSVTIALGGYISVAPSLAATHVTYTSHPQQALNCRKAGGMQQCSSSTQTQLASFQFGVGRGIG